MSYTNSDIAKFRKLVWNHWKQNGRHDLPWRQTADPYKILVSEVMLQQTQVPRVVEKYNSFVKKFPTARSLARARLSDVLKEWSGLGYNRRGKYLHDAAKAIVAKHGGKIPKDVAAIEALPGIGAYTAAAVRVFAFNEKAIPLETNIRAAYIHHFFDPAVQGLPLDKVGITDARILPIARAAAKGQDPRTWNWALMDYGSQLKHLHENPTRRSAHYSVQTKFEGSLRQVRGAILKALTEGEHGDLALAQKLQFDDKRVREALAGLTHDGLIVAEKGSWRIA